MKMEPTVSSETSAIRTQRPGNYPKRNTLHVFRGWDKILVNYSGKIPNNLFSQYDRIITVSKQESA